jgi:hypothetical protein
MSMKALYMSLDNAAVTRKSLSATSSFISDIAEGMKRVIEDMLPECADDQYGQLRLLVHGLTGIESAAFEIMPRISCDEDAKEGAV